MSFFKGFATGFANAYYKDTAMRKEVATKAAAEAAARIQEQKLDIEKYEKLYPMEKQLKEISARSKQQENMAILQAVMAGKVNMNDLTGETDAPQAVTPEEPQGDAEPNAAPSGNPIRLPGGGSLTSSGEGAISSPTFNPDPTKKQLVTGNIDVFQKGAKQQITENKEGRSIIEFNEKTQDWRRKAQSASSKYVPADGVTSLAKSQYALSNRDNPNAPLDEFVDGVSSMLGGKFNNGTKPVVTFKDFQKKYQSAIDLAIGDLAKVTKASDDIEESPLQGETTINALIKMFGGYEKARFKREQPNSTFGQRSSLNDAALQYQQGVQDLFAQLDQSDRPELQDRNEKLNVLTDLIIKTDAIPPSFYTDAGFSKDKLEPSDQELVKKYLDLAIGGSSSSSDSISTNESLSGYTPANEEDIPEQYKAVNGKRVSFNIDGQDKTGVIKFVQKGTSIIGKFEADDGTIYPVQ